MNTDSPNEGPVLPPGMRQKLEAVLRHERQTRLLTGLLRAAAVFLAAMLLMMAVDWLVAAPAGIGRWLMTLAAFAAAGAAVLIWCIRPLAKPHSLREAARQVDESHPKLEERAQTLTGFADSKDAPELRGSPAILRKVTAQAAALTGEVDPRHVISKVPLVTAAKFLGASAVLLALFFVLDFQRAKILAERFFDPNSDVTLTQLRADAGDLVLGKGEKLTLGFTASGKHTDYATLTLKSENGHNEDITLARDGKDSVVKTNSNTFTYTANTVSDSFEYRARSGDGQTAWHKVQVVERPSLSQAELKITSPAYSKIPEVDEKILPSKIRALEGSQMELTLQADQPLASLDLQFADGQLRHLALNPDGKYHFNATLTNSLAFTPIMVSKMKLENQDKPNCEILVYPDLPPTVRVISPENSISARSNDTIQIEFEARDDFGLSKADLVVNVNNGNGSNVTTVFPIALATNEVGARLIHRTVDLDLSQFNLQQDQELTYNIRVTDTRNSGSLSTPAPEAEPNAQWNAPALASRQNANAGTNASAAAGNLAQANPGQSPGNSPPASTNANGQIPARDQAGNQNAQNSGSTQPAQNQRPANPGQNPGSPPELAQNNPAQNQPGQPNGNPNSPQNQNTAPPSAQNSPNQNSAQNQAGAQNQNPSPRNPAQSPELAQNSPSQNSPQTQAGRESTVRIGSGQNSSQSQSGQQDGGQNPPSQDSSQSQAGQQGQSGSSSQQQQTSNQDTEKNPDANQNTNSSPQQSHLAMRSPTNSMNQANSPSDSEQRPNPMNQRALDVPGQQTTSGQQMRIKVDQYADSFNSQQREKKEQAIDPSMTLLDALLTKAHNLTEDAISAAHSKEGLGPNQAPGLEDDKDQLRQASRTISDLKKGTAGTPYAFIGLQLADIGDTHISPANEELGQVALETAKAKDDLDNLVQASAHITEARKLLAALTQTYDNVKRDNQLADAMQHLKKMHQIFLEDTQAMLGGGKPPINSVNRKIAEVSDDYVAQLNKLMEEQKKIVAEMAKILANDPRLLRRFLAQNQADATSLRDQLTLLNDRQKALTKQTAEWLVAGDTIRPVMATVDLGAEAAHQNEISAQASQMHENMITWLPEGVDQDQEPVATAFKSSAEGTRLAAESATHVVAPGTNELATGLDDATKALDQFRFLHEYLPELSDSEIDGKNLSVFTANRLNEDADLVTKQSGWIKKMEALRDGNFNQAAQVDQHQIALDTTSLGEKVEAAVIPINGLSPEIHAKSDQLIHTIQRQLTPEEVRAEDALGRNLLNDAASRQAAAGTAFNDAEKQFDELLRLLADKMDSSPPPTQPGANPTLDQMLAMLKEEQKTAESLGLPNRPINVQVMRDWMRPSPSQQGAGQPRGGGPPRAPQNFDPRSAQRAQARAQEQQAREQADRAARMAEVARQAARDNAQIAEHVEPGSGSGNGTAKPPANAWNTIASELGDELRQSRDNVPPEQYRQAIEQYFNTISQDVPPATAPAPAK